MISPCNPGRGLVVTVLSIVLAMLPGCVTSGEALLKAAAAPAKAGKYEVQYLVDGKWTKFAAGSLASANRIYTWAEDREGLSLLSSWPDRFRFSLVDMGNNYFIVVVASADLRNSIWVGKYVYGVARRAGGAFLYDFPSCLDLLVSQGSSDSQIERGKARECLYSGKASLTGALTSYARRTVMWKRLAPAGH